MTSPGATSSSAASTTTTPSAAPTSRRSSSTPTTSAATPRLPLGNFLRGRKTLTLGADFTYQNAWTLELRYVNFFGAGRYNLLGDRDYVSAT
jgi:hypothetical protein